MSAPHGTPTGRLRAGYVATLFKHAEVEDGRDAPGLVGAADGRLGAARSLRCSTGAKCGISIVSRAELWFAGHAAARVAAGAASDSSTVAGRT